MSDEWWALLIVGLIGVIPNLIIKLADKFKTPQETKKAQLEAADLSVDTLSQALEEMRLHNKFLEDKLTTKRDEITTQNKVIYDMNSRLNEILEQNSILTDQIIESNKKLQECLECINKMKEK